jgi:hypothetical protein
MGKKYVGTERRKYEGTKGINERNKEVCGIQTRKESFPDEFQPAIYTSVLLKNSLNL